MRVQHADFTMCNPPFYTSKDDMDSTWTKSAPPSAVCTGAEVEMITEGGDAGFVVRMVEESKELRETVQWYTSMLGKLLSVSVVIDSLKEAGCKNWAVSSLITGGKTRRWVVGWSWGDLRPRNVS
jgi:23S rRNA (adenine1618-N6)-methyltransferase